ncbi:hypothetical protein BGX21_001709 [Mortierella sp. AD011]|nr:hypothetical protein BGX20_010359 [Mortierella sp. AD010]KAF9382912.1 hypothetical protein BGX21_001709 [Mortierella sp. AD011]
MIHHKLKDYLSQYTDLTASSHFGFFSSVPELSEANACNIWIRDLSKLAKDSDPAIRLSVETLEQKYSSDKKSGAMKEYWNNRKLKREMTQSQREAAITLMPLATAMECTN